jgi:hypothetical protein
MNRRRFLKTGLFGGLLLAVGGTGLALWPSERRARPRRALRALDERQFAIVATIAGRTVTAPGADHVAVAERVDELAALMVPESRAELKQLVMLFENGLAGMIFDMRPRPFTRLSPEEQDAALLAWRNSRFAVRRRGYQVLRRLTQAAHYGAPGGWAITGYPGPPQLSVPT